MTLATGTQPLQPVRDALLAQARRDAEAVLARARADADELVAQVQCDVEQAVAQARLDGEAEAARAVSRDDAQARERARATVLAAERRVYDALATRVREAARGLHDAAIYPQLRASLERRARELLGPDCTIDDDPDGGIAARARGRTLRISLDTLARWALEDLGDEPLTVWSPR